LPYVRYWEEEPHLPPAFYELHLLNSSRSINHLAPRHSQPQAQLAASIRQ